MGLISSLFNHSITTSRLKAGSGIKQSYQTHLRNVACFIQPITAEMAAKTNMVFGKTYNCYLNPGTDVKEGDKVVDQDGNNYSVAGSLNRNYGGNPHLTVYLVKEEQA